jgi:hypothetical protein
MAYQIEDSNIWENLFGWCQIAFCFSLIKNLAQYENSNNIFKLKIDFTIFNSKMKDN